MTDEDFDKIIEESEQAIANMQREYDKRGDLIEELKSELSNVKLEMNAAVKLLASAGDGLRLMVRVEMAEAKLAKVEVLMSAGFAEYERRLAEMLEVGNVMAASIEGNYYIAGIATKWREAININGEQP